MGYYDIYDRTTKTYIALGLLGHSRTDAVRAAFGSVPDDWATRFEIYLVRKAD